MEDLNAVLVAFGSFRDEAQLVAAEYLRIRRGEAPAYDIEAAVEVIDNAAQWLIDYKAIRA